MLPVLASLLRRLVLANPSANTKLSHRVRSKEQDMRMRELFGAEGLLLRPVDVKSTAAASAAADPIKAEESIVFYRVRCAGELGWRWEGGDAQCCCSLRTRQTRVGAFERLNAARVWLGAPLPLAPGVPPSHLSPPPLS